MLSASRFGSTLNEGFVVRIIRCCFQPTRALGRESLAPPLEVAFSASGNTDGTSS